ncbi:MAG: penicillin-binding protein 1C [Candidatus Atribacteria bacterium]|nr:MAG: penicillin-binding protein 1C [Candidatus Atribacteria bacterium]
MNRKLKIFLITTGVIIIPVLLSPLPVFRAPLSTVVEARDGSLLGARIADDGQWRFPAFDKVPEKFEKSLLTFEDRYFYYHPGINPVSIVRALISNIKAGEIVSGGSTITMQVARIARGNRSRTYIEKFIEMFASLKLELLSSKKTILLMYSANAPFGGNTVGLEAAAWRYTGKSSNDLTWAEAAALAILPNSPALVFPGRNQEVLKNRRDMLLKRLYEREYFDTLTLVLALDEPLPGEPKSLPSKAPHLTDHFFMRNRGSMIRTTIDPYFQERATEIINNHQKNLAENYIFNSACLIVEVESGNVIAYVGNSSLENAAEHGGNVDIIRSMRSTGSILKPFLYAGMLQSGDILPNTLIADIPTRFPGFSPKNFDQSYSGAVSAGSALSQSLNIPAVKMLQKYNPEKLLDLLQKTGFTTFNKPADYYGLSLILGGGETSLWELTGVYASLSRVLNRYLAEKKYYKSDYHPPVLVEQENSGKEKTEDLDPPLSAASIWLTYEALQKVNRPVSETGWQYFSSSPNLAWKTGTSFGFRDGWAVGTTPGYVVGVWTGNADGEGRPGLTGISAAAPVLFDLVNLMGSGEWFQTPLEDLTMISVCTSSGFRAGPDCPETDDVPSSVNGLRSDACPYHQIIHLNKSGTLQVTSDCELAANIRNVPWFVLPPAMEYFYRQKHPGYKTLPPVDPRCTPSKNIPAMEFIYPAPGIRIFIPRDQTGQYTMMIPEVAHRNPSKKIFWHLDEKYICTTRFIHQIEIVAETGNHLLTVVDEDGNTIRCSFILTGKAE